MTSIPPSAGDGMSRITRDRRASTYRSLPSHATAGSIRVARQAGPAVDVLGHALAMKAVHTGNAKNDKLDSPRLRSYAEAACSHSRSSPDGDARDTRSAAAPAPSSAQARPAPGTHPEHARRRRRCHRHRVRRGVHTRWAVALKIGTHFLVPAEVDIGCSAGAAGCHDEVRRNTQTCERSQAWARRSAWRPAVGASSDL
jgi:hypothetical protein